MISIIIPHFQRTRLLRRTLLSVEAQKPETEYEVVVANDGKPDPLLASLVAEFHGRVPVRVLDTYRNLPGRGPAKPVNCAVKAAKGEHIVVQCPECLHVGSVIDGMAALLSAATRPYLVARCMSLKKDDGDWLDEHETEWAGDNSMLRRFDHPERGEYIGKTNKRFLYFLAGMKRDDYIAIGGIDERFTVQGFDDECCSWQLEKLCFDRRILFDEPFFCLHQHHERSTKQLQGYSAMAGVMGQIKREGAPFTSNRGREWGVLRNPACDSEAPG